jgi:hypothetical protein
VSPEDWKKKVAEDRAADRAATSEQQAEDRLHGRLFD